MLVTMAQSGRAGGWAHLLGRKGAILPQGRSKGTASRPTTTTTARLETIVPLPTSDTLESLDVLEDAA